MRGDERIAGQRPTRVGRGLDQHRLAAERGQDMPVGRIARIGTSPPARPARTAQEAPERSRRRSRWSPPRARIEGEAVDIARNARRCGARSDGNPERFGIADPPALERGAAAAIAVRGAEAAGWPTSICMTRRPAASIRAAAAITSMTMKGGTSLRREGVNRRFAISSMAVGPLGGRGAGLRSAILRREPAAAKNNVRRQAVSEAPP